MYENNFGSFLRETYLESKDSLVKRFIDWSIDTIQHDMINRASHGENHIEIRVSEYLQRYAPNVEKLEYKELRKVTEEICKWVDDEGFSRIEPISDKDDKYVDIVIIWGINREYPKEGSCSEVINQVFDKYNGGIFREFVANIIQQIRDELVDAAKNSNRYIVISEQDIAKRFAENNGNAAAVITKRHNIQLIGDMIREWACDNDITCNSRYNFRLQKNETFLVFI